MVEWRDCELYPCGWGQGQVAGFCKWNFRFHKIQGDLLTTWGLTSKEWLFFVELFCLVFLGIVCLLLIWFVSCFVASFTLAFLGKSVIKIIRQQKLPVYPLGGGGGCNVILVLMHFANIRGVYPNVEHSGQLYSWLDNWYTVSGCIRIQLQTSLDIKKR
jgi:hypothetical protein